MENKTKTTPKLFASYTNNKLKTTPKLFASYETAETIKVRGMADLCVTVENERFISVSGFTDTATNIKKAVKADAAASINAKKNIQGFTDTEVEISDKISFKINTHAKLEAEIKKRTTTLANIAADIKKNVAGGANTEIVRRVRAFGYVGMSGILQQKRKGNVDMILRVPYTLEKVGAKTKRLSLTLGEKTLSDTLTLETAEQIELLDAVQGRILNYDFCFLVESTSKTGLFQNVAGMYDIDLLLYTPFTYRSGENTAKAHAGRIAAGIGKKLNLQIDDFRPSSDFSGTGATYKNIISGLFGWTSELPQRQINVFIRGDTLSIIQRGKETQSIDITAVSNEKIKKMPTVERKIMRSVWSGNGESGATSTSGGMAITPLPFTGTIQFGDQSSTYTNGLLISERHGQEVTTYTYDNDYLIRKETKTAKETIRTVYTYATTAKDRFLAMETETKIDKDGNETERITRHVAIGHGKFGTTVEEDGEYKGSTIGDGKTGGKASRYCVDQSNLSFGATFSNAAGGEKINGTALINTSFPVEDYETLKKLTRAIEWLNRKTEERISMEIYQFDEVIDFTKKIIYQGNEYYLESNSIEQTPRETKQSITIVRWF